MTRFIRTLFVICLSITAAFAQTKLTVDDVIKMAKAGISEEVILPMVEQSDIDAPSVDQVLKLNEAGVSGNIIKAMVNGKQSVAAPVQTAPVAQPTQRQVVSLAQPPTASADGRPAGIYLEVNGNLTQLEPTVFMGGKTGGMFLSSVTAGLTKTKLKAVVRSEKSIQRLQTSSPVFYFYFENTGAGLSNTGAFAGFMNGASSPNEFVLARMTVKKGERELKIGQAWAFGNSQGVRPKDIVDFRVEKISPGVYKVTPTSPLTPDEYCFFYAAGSGQASQGTGKLFDFGVDHGSMSSY